jgi:hypothetical protein
MSPHIGSSNHPHPSTKQCKLGSFANWWYCVQSLKKKMGQGQSGGSSDGGLNVYLLKSSPLKREKIFKKKKKKKKKGEKKIHFLLSAPWPGPAALVDCFAMREDRAGPQIRVS